MVGEAVAHSKVRPPERGLQAADYWDEEQPVALVDATVLVPLY